MTKVLYILGAGASANVLPVINSFYDENETLRQSLSDELFIFSMQLNHFENYRVYHDLCKESLAFATPDTFAKFLYVTNRDSHYRKFKEILSAYFFWKERFSTSGEDCLDKRVISFLTTLTENNSSFPENIKIISWNYDSQFIRAIDKARNSVANNLFLPNFNIHPFTQQKSRTTNNASLIQLNGIAGYSLEYKTNAISNKYSFREDILKTTEIDGYRIKKIIDLLSHPNDNLLISYAWEEINHSGREYEYAKDRIEFAQKLAIDTKILVVIGYSFPFFNREIDKKIFKAMPSLEKIYFQDKNLNGDFLYSQFNLEKKLVKIETISNVKNYYVPYEL